MSYVSYMRTAICCFFCFRAFGWGWVVGFVMLDVACIMHLALLEVIRALVCALRDQVFHVLLPQFSVWRDLICFQELFSLVFLCQPICRRRLNLFSACCVVLCSVGWCCLVPRPGVNDVFCCAIFGKDPHDKFLLTRAHVADGVFSLGTILPCRVLIQKYYTMPPYKAAEVVDKYIKDYQ